ncbi:hypothetical protein HOK68_01105 [Candidatus Woesearchaeota archaeon]|nr:hypothetical protein [Candidatus Woesearchaeota archaeon]
MRPLLRVKNSEFEKIMTIFESNKENIIMDVPDIYDPEYKEYLNSFKTSLCLEEWINEAGENKILLNYNSTPGDLRVKIEKSMWLLYCISEISKIVNNMKIIKDINKLSMRIKYGVKEELLPLLKLKYIGRVRARVMHNNGIKNVLDIKKTDFNILSKLIGSAIAKNIREQIGIKENNISHTINDF